MRPQGKNAKNHHKSAILIFFSAITELVRELLISNMHNKFRKDTWIFFQVIAPMHVNAAAAELQLQ